MGTLALTLAMCLAAGHPKHAPAHPPASAASSAPTAAAKKEAGQHYQRGVGLYKDGDYASALTEFKAAYHAVPSFEVLDNIGLSERRVFKYAAAAKTLKQYLAEGGAKVPRDRRDAVEAELELIRGLTSSVTVNVEGPPAEVSGRGVLPCPGRWWWGPGSMSSAPSARTGRCSRARWRSPPAPRRR